MNRSVGTRVSVFFVSDSTGITAETLGSALLAHFPGFDVDRRVFSFVDTIEAARAVVRQVQASESPSIVFMTVRTGDVAAVLTAIKGTVVDLLGGHLAELETVLGVQSSTDIVKYHGVGDFERYHTRMRAVEYAVEHDDAQSLRMLNVADLIIIAPSRCGKTPTALYLALQHGLRVANYPLTEDDLPHGQLPTAVAPHLGRCFGLTSTPQRLSQVRQERRPGSAYASVSQCRRELRWAERLYRTHRIPHLNSEAKSVEEMAAVILQAMSLRGPTTSGART